MYLNPTRELDHSGSGDLLRVTYLPSPTPKVRETPIVKLTGQEEERGVGLGMVYTETDLRLSDSSKFCRSKDPEKRLDVLDPHPRS